MMMEAGTSPPERARCWEEYVSSSQVDYVSSSFLI